MSNITYKTFNTMHSLLLNITSAKSHNSADLQVHVKVSI